MSLIVETGQAGSDSESFISVADADTYFGNRGNATWAALSESQKEQNLRKGTDYLEQVYRLNWLGYRHTTTQALSWPRDEVPQQDAPSGYGQYPAYYDNDVVPAEVQRACAELALKASRADLSPDIGRRTIREKVDVVEVEYSEYGAQTVTYRAIDNMLAPFLGVGGGSIRKVIRT